MIKSKFIQMIILFIVFSFDLSSQNNQQNCNPNFEFTGIYELWEIIDILKQDEKPTQKQWEDLVYSPGYSEIIKRELDTKTFPELLTLTFMPSKAKELQEIFNDNEYSQRKKMMLNAFLKSDSLRDEIKIKIEELKNFSFTEKATKEALEYLPENSNNEFPSVSFIIWGLNSRGYDPIIMAMMDLFMIEDLITTDILHSMHNKGFTKNRILVLGMGHEFFHFYRDKKLEFNYPNYDSVDYDIIWTINQIENEGIAEQIDCRQLFYDNGFLSKIEWADFHREEQKEQPNLLNKLDSLFIEIIENPQNTKKLGKEIKNLIPRSGHPTGFFMTNIILKNLGKRSLIEVVRNPFQFFILYNESAKKDDTAFVFSDKSIEFIKQLERKYSKFYNNNENQ